MNYKYDDLIHRAAEFAAVRHRDQRRKGTDTPYIAHPLEVGVRLAKCGCSDEVIAGGILHDTLEDTATTFDELGKEFGLNIARLVKSVSEDKSKSWMERKNATIDALPKASTDTVMICLSDKLCNLVSIACDYKVIGDALWDRFNADKNSIAWYYKSVIENTKQVDCALRDELIYYYDVVFNDKGKN